MHAVLKVVKDEIAFKLKWLRETRVQLRLFVEENPKARTGNIKKFIRREQEELVELRKIKKMIKSKNFH